MTLNVIEKWRVRKEALVLLFSGANSRTRLFPIECFHSEHFFSCYCNCASNLSLLCRHCQKNTNMSHESRKYITKQHISTRINEHISNISRKPSFRSLLFLVEKNTCTILSLCLFIWSNRGWPEAPLWLLAVRDSCHTLHTLYSMRGDLNTA